MTLLYKLTDQDGYTRRDLSGETLWQIGAPVTATGAGSKLCTDGVIHAYTDPLLAVLLHPIHANFLAPRLFEAEGEIVADDYGLKVGVKTLTLLRESPVPEITTEQRVRFAIMCAKQVRHDPDWLKWADNWLSGGDRSDAATRAARAAARAAACATRAARAAAWADAPIDLAAIAREAMMLEDGE